MRHRLLATALLVAAAASPPALAQQNQETGGVPTETQRRLAQGGSDVPWDLIGLLGLFGLLGLKRPHSDDSYHPAPLE